MSMRRVSCENHSICWHWVGFSCSRAEPLWCSQPESRSSIGSGGENDNSKCSEPGPGRADKKQVQKFECRAIVRSRRRHCVGPLGRRMRVPPDHRRHRHAQTTRRPARRLIPASTAASARFLKSIASGLPISPPRYMSREQRVGNVPLWESLFNSQRMGAAPARSVFLCTAADYPLECHELSRLRRGGGFADRYFHLPACPDSVQMPGIRSIWPG